MNWRVGLACAILGVWFYFLINAGNDDAAKLRFDRLNPVALVAVGFIFAEPVARERLARRRRSEDDESGDEASDE
jgi:hypothetical protein